MGACYSTIEEGHVGMLEKFGEYYSTLPPGFHCIPCVTGWRLAGVVCTRARKVNVQCEINTKDDTKVLIKVSVHNQVVEGKEFDSFYKMTDSTAQFKSYIFDIIRSRVPSMTLTEVFASKLVLAERIKEDLDQSMERFGYKILDTWITDIIPENKVEDSRRAPEASYGVGVDNFL